MIIEVERELLHGQTDAEPLNIDGNVLVHSVCFPEMRIMVPPF